MQPLLLHSTRLGDILMLYGMNLKVTIWVNFGKSGDRYIHALSYKEIRKFEIKIRQKIRPFFNYRSQMQKMGIFYCQLKFLQTEGLQILSASVHE